ncbi:MAG: hypothetical protein L6W00_19845 [Lentisphaeria bacterium]|nr:MAG: hypothetical protein L6W00_19845 [Lentisphaeria bacterium]
MGDSAGARPPRERTDGTGRRESVRSGEGKREIFLQAFLPEIDPISHRSLSIDNYLSITQYNMKDAFFNSFDKKRSKFFSATGTGEISTAPGRRREQFRLPGRQNGMPAAIRNPPRPGILCRS